MSTLNIVVKPSASETLIVYTNVSFPSYITISQFVISIVQGSLNEGTSRLTALCNNLSLSVSSIKVIFDALSASSSNWDSSTSEEFIQIYLEEVYAINVMANATINNAQIRTDSIVNNLRFILASLLVLVVE